MQSGKVMRRRKEEEYENSYGIDFARSTGKHRPQDRILAGRIRRTVLRFSGRWGRVDSGLAKGMATTGRSQERFTGKPTSCDGPVQEGRESSERAFPNG